MHWINLSEIENGQSGDIVSTENSRHSMKTNKTKTQQWKTVNISNADPIKKRKKESETTPPPPPPKKNPKKQQTKKQQTKKTKTKKKPVP